MPFQNARIIGSGINPAEYHDIKVPRGDARYPVSPSMLKEGARCWSRWKNGYVRPGSDAMAYGNLIDTLALTPELFTKRYAVVPADAPKKPTKAQYAAKKPSPESERAMDWWDKFTEEHAGCETIGEEEHEEAMKAVTRLRTDPEFAKFFEHSEAQVLIQGEWMDEASGLVVPVRCLLDLLPRSGSPVDDAVADVKQVRSAAHKAFRTQVHDMGWHVQAAFDMDLLAAAGDDRHTWSFLLQENYEPYEVGRRTITRYDTPQDAPPENFYALGRATYARGMAEYCQCLKTGIWPGYDSTDVSGHGWTEVCADPWMAHAFMFGPRAQFGEEPEQSNAETQDEDNFDTIP